MTKKDKNQLTAKQSAFVAEYLIDLNATQAAIRAGYSKKTATETGYENLTKPHIAEAIADAQAKRAKRIEISQNRVLEEYSKLAFLNPKQFYNDTGGLIPIHELPDDVAAALTGMDVSTLYEDKVPVGELKRIKFADKKSALDSVAKHLGMFIERKALVDSEGKDVLREVLDQVAGITRGLPNRDQRKVRE